MPLLRAPRLLVTGFGPFPGVPANPTTDVVNAVAAARPDVATALLATEWQITERVADLAGSHDTVLMFGVAARSRRIRYERLSLPHVSQRPDAAGRTAGVRPRAAWTRIDAAALAAEARRAGFAVAVSGSAGTYICNASYAAALGANPRTLFVHVPEVRPRGPVAAGDLVAHALWLVDRLAAEPARRG